MERMHPSLTTILVTLPESYALVAMVALGIMGIAASILISETIVFYWSSGEGKAVAVRANKKAC